MLELDDAPDADFFIPLSIVETRRNSTPSYIDFFNMFVANVVGKKTFESHCWRQKASQFVTVSDEALALLMYENNYERWTDMGKNDNWKSSAVRPKYTSGGNACQTPMATKHKKNKKVIGKTQVDDNPGSENKNDSTCARYQGWSLEGIRRYNFLFDAVKAERASPLGIQFDDAFLQYCKENKDDNDKKLKKGDVAFEACRHELWDSCNVIPGDISNQNTNVMMNNYTIITPGDNSSMGSSSASFAMKTALARKQTEV